MLQTKYALAVPKNLGLGLNFRPCSEGYFKDKLQEWMEHWGTDFWKFETSRENLNKFILFLFKKKVEKIKKILEHHLNILKNV